MDRRRFFAIAFSVSALPLTGCPKPSLDPGPEPSPTPESGKAQTSKKGKKLRAGLVTDTGGVNDKSFNAQAWAGLVQARDTLGYQIKLVESRQSTDYVPNLEQFAKAGYDVVVAVGFLMAPAVQEVSVRYPSVYFALIDGEAPDTPNAVGYRFREQEGAFLVGALAALVSKSGVIGFVGGLEVPLAKKFEFGFQAGATTVRKDIQVRVGYTGSFTDTQKGQEIALLQMSTGADILFHAAGKSGLGVIKAVAQKGGGRYAVGVDRDQDSEAPGHVLTSMIKRVDRAVLEVCQKVATDTFTSGTVELGLKEDALGLSEMKYTRDKLPAGALEKIEGFKKRIIGKTLTPPATGSDYQLFVENRDDPAN